MRRRQESEDEMTSIEIAIVSGVVIGGAIGSVALGSRFGPLGFVAGIPAGMVLGGGLAAATSGLAAIVLGQLRPAFPKCKRCSHRDYRAAGDSWVQQVD